MAQSLQREPLYRQIYNQLESQIVSGQLQVGDTLASETELAESYGVNRSSVREALRLLEENDLVGRAPGKKKLEVTAPKYEKFSRRISTSMLIDQVTLGQVYESILILEPILAGLAAQRVTTELVERLEENLAQMHAALDDYKRLETLDHEFHSLLAEASNNRVLQWSRLGMSELFYPAESTLLANLEDANLRMLKAHENIVAAIKQKDPVAAEEWARKHVQDFGRGCEKLGYSLDSQPNQFGE
ncbi:transcriptional regulator, GntR family [Pseudomonas pohangensis]|uniref:Transcriptional regulator, GntR family n=1 Tax=Pseudomonas pohangensis TaxID=364197 RepID=A0A1H2FM16_9PSED|nr:FCD domain-containing protein [Pseudomonas pohangensis]SDU08393.1 transcriptional regulator, GntR family [Pseudomonas pohangensis]